MAYVPVPKDLNAVKTKVMFNLTKRQLICFSLAGLCVLPVYFAIKDVATVNIATLALMVVCFPFFLFAMYEKHGQPLEVILMQMFKVKYGVSKERPYKSQNFYEQLEIEYDLNMEVKSVAKSKKRTSSEKQKSRK